VEYLIKMGFGLVAFLLLHFVIGKYPDPLPLSKNRRREILETLVIWAVMVVATTALIFWVPPDQLAAPTPRFVATALLVLFVPYPLLPVLFVLRVNKWTAKDLGFAMPRSRSVTIFAIVFFAIGGIVPFIISSGFEPITAPHLLLALYSPAFLEELFFRGIIQGKLERALGQNRAWFYSGILFGLAHFSSNFFGPLWYSKGENITGALLLLMQQTIFGWVFGVIYAKTRSLLPTMVGHYLLDGRLGLILRLIVP